ncbi:hypothetical protein BU23DRAFT_554076 [Bimuria novae-zelandiae CBS 107.79]|uniref:Uncharacterized protein n=1 Tax=Bimuria novae-zelandiae CBS 107.79 TaxID=1447943 RepID=A0A6A5V8L8_9PLEO|nr:hypothetical protein BU23DRAFT_554076 [Bimuria novae-zelandiae CBS 107.79]
MSIVWSDNSIAECLENVLGQLSPSAVLGSERLRLAFGRFFARGTELECWQLFRGECQSLVESVQALPRLAPSKHRPLLLEASCDPLPLVQPPPLHAPIYSNPPNVQSHAHQHFKSLGLPSSKITLLTKIVGGFSSAKPPKEGGHLQEWTDEDPCTSDVFARTKEVAKSLLKEADVGYCNRLRLLFFAHGVDRAESTVVRPRNQRKKSAALDTIAEQCKMERKKVNELYNRKRNYLLLAKECGLGFLLDRGTNMSDIESLSIEDIEHISHYLTENVRSVIDRFQSLNTAATRAIIQGLKHYGWTLQELAQGGSELMTLVANYVDIKALEHGEIRDLKDIGGGRTKRRKRRAPVSITGIQRVRVQKQKLGGTSAEALLFAPASDADNAGEWPRVISNPHLLEEPTPGQAHPTRQIEVYSDAIPPSEPQISHQSPSPADAHPSTPAQVAPGFAENDSGGSDSDGSMDSEGDTQDLPSTCMTELWHTTKREFNVFYPSASGNMGDGIAR